MLWYFHLFYFVLSLCFSLLCIKGQRKRKNQSPLLPSQSAMRTPTLTCLFSSCATFVSKTKVITSLSGQKTKVLGNVLNLTLQACLIAATSQITTVSILAPWNLNPPILTIPMQLRFLPKTVIMSAMFPGITPGNLGFDTSFPAHVIFTSAATLTPSIPPVIFQMFYLIKCATRSNLSNCRAAPQPLLSPKRITKENGGARALPFVYRGCAGIGGGEWLWWIWGYLGDFSTKFLPNVLPLELEVKQKGKTGVKHFGVNEWYNRSG